MWVKTFVTRKKTYVQIKPSLFQVDFCLILRKLGISAVVNFGRSFEHLRANNLRLGSAREYSMRDQPQLHLLGQAYLSHVLRRKFKATGYGHVHATSNI